MSEPKRICTCDAYSFPHRLGSGRCKPALAEDENFYIMCEVYGGTTGHRTSILKKDGVMVTFPTREAAEAELPRSYTSETGVTFKYWIEEVL